MLCLRVLKKTRRADRAMKISKSEAQYGRGTREEHCGRAFEADTGYCRYFISPTNPTSDTGTCTQVTGSIGRVYWCRLWSRARKP